MSSTIGGISIEVSADIARLVDATVRATQHTERFASTVKEQMQRAADSVGESLRGLAGAVGIAFSIEKVVEFGKAALDQAEKVRNLSMQLGVSTQSVQALGFAAGLTGKTLDDVSTSLTKLERSAVQAQSGNKQMEEGFRAIGVSVTDATGKLKPADQLFTEVAQHLSQFADGPTKVAVAMQLMGRGAADSIPFLNQLGQNVDGLRKQAEDLGLVLGDKQQKALLQAKEAFNLLGLEMKGLGNTAMAALAPALTEVADRLNKFLASGQAKAWATGFGNAISSVLELFDRMKFAFTALIAAGDQAWQGMKVGLQVAIEYMKFYFQDFVAYVKNTAVEISASLAKIQFGGTYSAQIDAAAQANRTAAPSFDEVSKRVSVLVQGLRDQAKASNDAVDAAYLDLNAVKKVGEETEKATGKVLNFKAAKDASAEAARKLAKDEIELADFLDKLSGKIGGPYAKAYEEYQAAINRADAMVLKFTQDGMAAAQVQQFLADATALAKTRFFEQTDAGTALGKVYDDITKKLAEQTRQLTLSGTARAIEVEQTKVMAEVDKALLSAMGPLTEADQKRIDALKAVAAQTVITDEAIKKSIEVQKQWESIVTSGFGSVGKSIADFATGAIKSWKDFGNSLLTDAKQFIAQIIEQFLKLQVFNGIINGIFGLSGGGALPTFASLAASGSGSGGFGGGGSSPIGGGLFGGNGGTGVIGKLADLFGGGGSLASSGAIAGGGSYTLQPVGGAAGGGMGFGQLAGIAGGVYAGYNRYQEAGGGVNGLIGGAAYGLGTITAAGAAAGAFGAAAGGIGAAGAGAAAGGSAAMAGIGVIPVIGWIALAAMLIDHFSGGKLFGTKGKPIGGNQTETIGEDGASVATEMTLKGQKAWFGGAKWTQQTIATDPATIQAANDFYTALKTGRDDFAKQFNVSVGAIVGGSFNTSFDKNGKPTGTTDTVLGVTYKGETNQQFSERLQADNYLAVLDKMGLGASKFVQGLQGNADKLYAAVQDFAATTQNINTNIGNGFKLLGVTGAQTIVTVMQFVQGLAQGGETLSQAYARLLQAQVQYNNFVAGFKPAPEYVNSFEASMAKVYNAMLANSAQADALAKAAGMSAAATSDLTNIQKSAAIQMAQLVLQLQASAQSLAFSLGLTLIGSLDQINQRIAALSAPITTATSSVSNFGSAMTQVSQAATAAMNLLLGNLSPLNDQQKLQVALQAQRAGTATPDQVLGIGRSLYASSQAYNDLFAQVMSVGDRTQKSSGGGGGGSNSGSTTTAAPMTPELAALIKERDTLQAGQTLSQYRTLAQQIQEIASAKGQTYQEIIKGMGIDIAQLEKGLGLKNDAALKDYMANLQKQTDSAGQNTTSIVQAINNLPQQIANAISGKPINPNIAPAPPGPPPVTPAAPGATDPTNPNRVGPPGTRAMTADDIGAAVAKFLAPVWDRTAGSMPRSGRGANVYVR